MAVVESGLSSCTLRKSAASVELAQSHFCLRSPKLPFSRATDRRGRSHILSVPFNHP